MEKKTRFKLHFIKTHISTHGLKKPSKKKNKLLFMNADRCKPLLLYKYFDPVSSHRIIGDLVFLDKLSPEQEYVPLNSLWTPFKYISEILITKNFTICQKVDSELYTPQVGFLIDRLLSLGETSSYNLAMSIKKLSMYFPRLPCAKEEIAQGKENHSNLLEVFLEKNAHFPIVLYHYKVHSKLGMVNSKIAVNSILKNITFQDDIRVFEESIFVCPRNQYFSYMFQHLENCFQSKNDEYLTLFVNTYQGVKRLLAKGENFIVNGEHVVAVTFPKGAQNPDVQRLYEDNHQEELEKKLHAITSKKIKKTQKITKKTGIKNLKDWEALIKKYYDPMDHLDEQRRCKYRVIYEENKVNYPVYSKF